jgi:hypothetical protein
MKLTNARLAWFANALELLSPSMGLTQQTMQAQGEPAVKTPRVKGNLNHPILAYRIGRARIAITPLVETLQQSEMIQLNATRVAPPKVEGQPLPPEDQWPSDAKKYQEAMRPIMEEEIDLGDLKPITWEILQKAGIVGGKPAGENEIEFDGSFVAALGDFLTGEPPDTDNGTP